MSNESENEHYEGEEEEDNLSDRGSEEADSEEDENAARLLEEEEKSVRFNINADMIFIIIILLNRLRNS